MTPHHFGCPRYAGLANSSASIHVLVDSCGFHDEGDRHQKAPVVRGRFWISFAGVGWKGNRGK